MLEVLDALNFGDFQRSVRQRARYQDDVEKSLLEDYAFDILLGDGELSDTQVGEVVESLEGIIAMYNEVLADWFDRYPTASWEACDAAINMAEAQNYQELRG
jgi:hypothetical protein